MTKLDFNKVSYDEGRRMLYSAVAGPFTKTAAGNWTDTLGEAGRKALDWMGQKGQQLGHAAQEYGGKAWNAASPYVNQGKEWLEKNYADPSMRPWLNIGGGAALGGALGLGSSLFQDSGHRSPISRTLTGAILGGMGGGGLEMAQQFGKSVGDDANIAKRTSAEFTKSDEIRRANEMRRLAGQPLIDEKADPATIERELRKAPDARTAWSHAIGQRADNDPNPADGPALGDSLSMMGRAITEPTRRVIHDATTGGHDATGHDYAMAGGQTALGLSPLVKHLPGRVGDMGRRAAYGRPITPFEAAGIGPNSPAARAPFVDAGGVPNANATHLAAIRQEFLNHDPHITDAQIMQHMRRAGGNVTNALTAAGHAPTQNSPALNANGVTENMLRTGRVMENGRPMRMRAPGKFALPRSIGTGAMLYSLPPLLEQGIYAGLGQSTPLQDQLSRESLMRYQQAQQALHPQ